MSRRSPACIGLALALVIAGCDRSTGPTDGPEVRFAERTDRMLVPVPSASSPAAGTIVVYGSLRTPCHPYGASAEALLDGGRIELVVTGRAPGDCPADVVSALEYRAELVGVPPGTYLLSVEHRYADADWPAETVLAEAVTVR